MDSQLEKIDLIRSRFNVSYEDAANALKNSQGDVVEALASIEKQHRADLLSLGVEMADEVQKLLAGGPIRKLRIKYGGKLIAEKAVALTAAATIAIGVAAILISRLNVEVDRGEGELPVETPG